MAQDLLQVVAPDGTINSELEPTMDAEWLLECYRYMVLVRILDARCMNLQRQGRIHFYVPSSGQEACQIGIVHRFAEPLRNFRSGGQRLRMERGPERRIAGQTGRRCGRLRHPPVLEFSLLYQSDERTLQYRLSRRRPAGARGAGTGVLSARSRSELCTDRWHERVDAGIHGRGDGPRPDAAIAGRCGRHGYAQ